jgi:6-pyruvoyltetrahydropterin/6-carboxytetrahydropterin synthase
MSIVITREHEICAGHRVYGHEGACRNLHGHQYKFELTVTADTLDSIGRVIDFSVIKTLLCEWLDKNWDHKMLLWNKDTLYMSLRASESFVFCHDSSSVIGLPCNPTVENLAKYFVEDIAPGLLLNTGVTLVQVKLWETSKCSATYMREDYEIIVRNRSKNASTEESGELHKTDEEESLLPTGERSSQKEVGKRP